MAITLKSFSSEAEARLAQGLLTSRGIESGVHRFSRYRAMASGGWQLKVAEFDQKRAAAVLNEAAGPVDMDEYVDPDDSSYRRCEKCGSVMITAAPLPNRLKLLAAIGLGIPLFFIPRNWTCSKCRHTWRK
jgi:hypothetical protein